MERSYTVKGLTCPSCAAKITEDIRKLEGVLSADINIFQQKLAVLFAAGTHVSSHYSQIRAIVEKYEPDVEVIEEQTKTTHTFHCEGLTCPNCAEKIVHDVLALPSVQSCSFQLLSQSLLVETRLDPRELLEDLRTIVSRYEPDVSVELRTALREDSQGTGSRIKATVQKIGGLCFLLLFYPWYAGLLTEEMGFYLYLLCYLAVGFPVLIKAVRSCMHARFFDENTLMTIATLGAFALGEYPEGCAVLLLYEIGEYFQQKAVARSRRSIAHLMDLRPTDVRVLRGEQVEVVPPESLKVGDTVLVRPGEKVPVDGIVLTGSGSLDTHALTGESRPRRVAVGETVLSGTIALSSQLTIRASHTYADSTVAKIIALVEDAQARKSTTERFITRFARWYTPVVVVAAVAIVAVPSILGLGTFSEWLHRACVFLIISCPCALVLSVPLTFFAGIGAASKNGILVKGGTYLEALAALDTVVFDKTGTLTQGHFSLADIRPEVGVAKDVLLAAAALAESRSLHPIALSLRPYLPSDAGLVDVTEYPGEGVCATTASERLLVGNERLLARFSLDAAPLRAAKAAHGDAGTSIAVVRNGQLLGCLTVADSLRPDSAAMIPDLRSEGIRRLVVLSGDAKEPVAAVAGELKITDFRAALLPQDKVDEVEALLQSQPRGRTLAFVGDGINDAPVLARADVGIAMGTLGADAALEAADVVLMTDEPSRLVTAIRIAKETLGIARQTIVFALSVKVLFLLFGSLGYLGLWAAVFGDVGVTLLAVANALRVRSA